VEAINIQEKFTLFNDLWSPKIIGELNGQQVKLAKVKGNFVWHDHKEEDELFLIIKGILKIEFRDRTIELKEGEMLVIPAGTEHRPLAEEEVHLLLFEPAATKHTGEHKYDITVEKQDWI